MEFNNTVIIIIFFGVLIIIGLVIWIIYMMVPKNTAGLFSSCVHQTDCATGLVCSKNTTNQFVCLGGLQQACSTKTDCAENLICSNNICVSPTGLSSNTLNTLNTLNDNIYFGNSTQNLNPNIFNQYNPNAFNYQSFSKPLLKPITSLNQLY